MYGICFTLTQVERTRMKPPSKPKRRKESKAKTAARRMSTSASRRAAIFLNGRNQAVRLPQELRFPEDVKEVRIRKQGDNLVLSPLKPDWVSFFALEAEVPEDFLERRDSPPQQREPL